MEMEVETEMDSFMFEFDHRKLVPVEATITPSTKTTTATATTACTTASRGGHFNHAHDFVIQNPTMLNVGMIQHFNFPSPGPGHTSSGLTWLLQHILPGTEHDSFDRSPPPRCHPGTRSSIIDSILKWLHNDSDDRHPSTGLPGHIRERRRNLLWLHGPAGVGKSALLQTLAELSIIDLPNHDLQVDMDIDTSGARVGTGIPTHNVNVNGTGSRIGRFGVEENLLVGASFFFSKPNQKTDGRKLLPSLAYQLAVKCPIYQGYICELMLKDPGCLAKSSLEEQFRLLIVVPFRTRMVGGGGERGVGGNQKPVLVIIDGLDECGYGNEEQGQGQGQGQLGRGKGRGQSILWEWNGFENPSVDRRKGEEIQRKLIQLISQFVSQNPTIPLLWLIASRPEQHLVTLFSRKDISTCCREESVLVDSDESCRDVEYFLRHEFNRIRQDYPHHISSQSSWPTEDQFQILNKASTGLFIFASLIIRFIDDPMIGNPVSQLNCVLRVVNGIQDSPTNQQNQNPLAALESMYSEILQRIPTNIISTTKLLLCLAILEGPEYPLVQICNVLGISRDIAYTALQGLRSILDIPSPKDADDRNIRFLHKSFQDYLQYPESFGNMDMVSTRNRCLSICDQDLGKAITQVWRGYSRILLHANSDCAGPYPNLSLVPLSWPVSDPEWRNRLSIWLFKDVKYFWIDSLTSINNIEDLKNGYILLNGICTSTTTTSHGGGGGFQLHGRVPGLLQVSELFSMLCCIDFGKIYGFLPLDDDESSECGAIEIGEFVGSLWNISSFFIENRWLGLVQHTTLGLLDIEGGIDNTRIAIRYSAESSKVWSTHNPFSEIDFNEDWYFLLEAVRLRKRQFPSTKVMIWGIDPTKRCVIFEVHYDPDTQPSKYDIRERLEGKEKCVFDDGLMMFTEIFFLPYQTQTQTRDSIQTMHSTCFMDVDVS